MDAKTPGGGLDCPTLSLPQQTASPSVRRAQVWLHPALIDLNRSSDGTSSAPCPSQSLPQHSASPFARRPQVWSDPALMSTKRPEGGVAPPFLLSPQHSASPLLLKTQACPAPKLILTKLPSGGVPKNVDVFVVASSPAHHIAIRVQAASAVSTSTYVREIAVRRACLTVMVPAPTHRFAV